MSRKNSKQIGNAYERAVAKRFSIVFEGQFKRTPSSGALVGGSNRQKADGLRSDAKEILASDVIAPEAFPFSVECKSYADEPKFHHLIQGESRTLNKWIEQVDADARFANKRPLIVFKINRKGEYVCFDRDIPDINLEEVPYIVYRHKIIVSLDNFLGKVLGNSYFLGNDK